MSLARPHTSAHDDDGPADGEPRTTRTRRPPTDTARTRALQPSTTMSTTTTAMTTTTLSTSIATSRLTATRDAPTETGSRARTLHPEIPWFIAALVALNLHAIPGVAIAPEPQVYFTDLVRDGEWWRVLTHPFVHVTWYHLLLDGVAFLLLYAGLESRRVWERLVYAATGAAGSLGLALAISPRIGELGLCGLSGAAHGLMAVAGLELITGARADVSLPRTGWTLLALVVAKGLWELATGRVLFEFLQFGMTGTPIAVSHAGGILGATAGFLVCRAFGVMRSRASA